MSTVRADGSAGDGFHGIDVEAGSHHNEGIRGFVEADQRVENLVAIRQMPGCSAVFFPAFLVTRSRLLDRRVSCSSDATAPWFEGEPRARPGAHPALQVDGVEPRCAQLRDCAA